MTKEFANFGLSPTSLRSIGNVRASISDDRIAFLLGAGFDKAIIEDSPDWSEVVSTLGLSKSGSKKIASQWPTELALLYKYQHPSKDAFYDNLKEKINSNKMPSGGAIKVFRDSFSKCNLFITLNYSNTANHILCEILKKNGNGKRLYIYDREYLKTLEGDWFPKKNDVYLIHLHGRCSDRSSPILDAWGYNVVSNDDMYYRRFLEDVFASRNVISFGVSWRDVPLRNSAAKVRLGRGYAARSHVMLDFRDDKKSKIASMKAQKMSDLRKSKTDWRNAMRLAYGVEPIHYTDSEQKGLLSLLTDKLDTPVSATDFEPIANYLDKVGDYESPQQINFLESLSTAGGGADPVTKVADGVRILSEAIICALDKNCIDLVTAARIERHLRHHLYLYLPEDKCLRKGLWLAINNRVTYEERGFDERLCFDHAIGKFELLIDKEKKQPTGFSPMFAKRFELASNIWKTDIPPKCYDEMAKQLLLAGWEMMAAKVLGDDLQQQVRYLAKEKACKIDSGVRRKIMDLADRVANLARMSGATRRWIKADIIAAMWDTDPYAARQKLLSLHHSGNIDAALEPGTYAGLLIALLVVEVNVIKDKKPARKIEEAHLLESLSEIGEEKKSIKKEQLKYWLAFSPTDSTSALRVL